MTKHAEKPALAGLLNVDVAEFSSLIKGIAGGGLRQLVGSPAFQEFVRKCPNYPAAASWLYLVQQP